MMELIRTKRFLLLALVVFIMGMLNGCSLLDLNNDGKIDPYAYLQEADITVTWTDEAGSVYTVDAMQLGAEVLYNYVEMKTGYRFELAEQQDGSTGIKVTDPNGYTVWITPAPIVPRA